VAKWPESVVAARYLVGSLGEDAATPWWNTTATSAVARRMLARMFPRTVLNASLETVSRAAAIVHDQQIGRLGAYHLFRLPVAEEVALAEYLRAGASDAVLQRLADLPDRPARIAALAALANGEHVDDAYGPMHYGTTMGLRRGKTVQRLCAAYLGAFTAERTAYPFLLEAETL
jgi:hypothetical protein